MLDPQKVDDLISEFEITPELEMMRLQEMARELSCQHYWYTKILADVAKVQRVTRAQRKASFSQLVHTFSQSETSNAAARAKAENNTEYRELYAKEYEYEGREKAGVRICDAIKKVLDRMGQEIADLRDEKKYQRFTGADTKSDHASQY
mgnify:CR=1 FL=1|jgi:hypothetical protein